MTAWIDTHTHLYFDAFDDDREEVFQRSIAGGVTHMAVIGTSPQTNLQALDFAKDKENVFATVGFHPHEASEVTDKDFSFLEEQAALTEVVAVGEMGLDSVKSPGPLDEQEAVFRRQIELALTLDKPIVIHNRETDDQMIKVLTDPAYDGLKGVLHCFASGEKLARVALDRGLFISFSGIVTFKNAKEIQEVAKFTPDDRIVVETDCPFLAPTPYRGKRCEPIHTAQTGTFVAELRGVDVESFAQLTTANACRLYGVSIP